MCTAGDVPNRRYVAAFYATYVQGTAELFGRTVTPLGLFITGAWMYHRYLLAYSGDAQAAAAEAADVVRREGRWWRGRMLGILSTLAAKLVLVPLVTLVLARVLGNLGEKETQGAVLIATVPVGELTDASMFYSHDDPNRHSAFSFSRQFTCNILTKPLNVVQFHVAPLFTRCRWRRWCSRRNTQPPRIWSRHRSCWACYSCYQRRSYGA